MSAKPPKPFPPPRIIQKPTRENKGIAVVECHTQNGRVQWKATRIVFRNCIKFRIISKTIFIDKGVGMFLSEKKYDKVTIEFCRVFGIEEKNRKNCKIRGRYPTWVVKEKLHRPKQKREIPQNSPQRSFIFPQTHSKPRGHPWPLFLPPHQTSMRLRRKNN